MKVTLKQIADIAGVHRSTVDKVIHERGGVSEEVAERIRKIIDELGYEPNIIGKALASHKNPFVIAVVLLEMDAVTEIKEGIEEAYKEYQNFGLKFEYYILRNMDESQQLSIFEVLKSKKINGLIISPINVEGVKHAINDLVDSGIPVVTVNLDISDSKRMCFVGQDMMAAGRVAGELMGEILCGKGRVAVITGSMRLMALYERQISFEGLVKERYPGLEIVDVIDIYEDKIAGFQKTVELLKREKNLDGLYITCGNVSEIVKAVKLMGRENQIKIISFDLYPEIVELTKQGIINFTIGQDLFAQGYKSVKVMFDYLFFNRTPEADHIKTSIDIRLRENVEL